MGTSIGMGMSHNRDPRAAGQWDSQRNEFDLYREWALAVCHGSRRSTPAVARWPDRDGLWEPTSCCMRRPDGRASLSAPGTPTQPVEAGYMANAWMRLRHPDFDVLHGILNEIGKRVQVRAH